MKLRILFGLRKERYKGQHSPEIVLAWSEFQIDENPGRFEELCAAMQSPMGDFGHMKVIDVVVDAKQIRDLLIKIPAVPGVVKSNETC